MPRKSQVTVEERQRLAKAYDERTRQEDKPFYFAWLLLVGILILVASWMYARNVGGLLD